MRKYISTGSIFPYKKEVNFLFPEGNLYPPKYITMNTNKETHKLLRVSEDTRIGNNLAIVSDCINFSSSLKEIFYQLIKSGFRYSKPNIHIRFHERINDSNIYWNEE